MDNAVQALNLTRLALELMADCVKGRDHHTALHDLSIVLQCIQNEDVREETVDDAKRIVDRYMELMFPDNKLNGLSSKLKT